VTAHDPAALLRLKEAMAGLHRLVLSFCTMVDHVPMPDRQRGEINNAFNEAKAALWDVNDTLVTCAREMKEALDE